MIEQLSACLANEGYTSEGIIERYVMVMNSGHHVDTVDDSAQARAHFRYRAAACLVKLAKVRLFDKALASKFETIATIMVDPEAEVRRRIVMKLGEVLPSQRLSPRWNILPALSAIDPEVEVIQLVSRAQKSKHVVASFTEAAEGPM